MGDERSRARAPDQVMGAVGVRDRHRVWTPHVRKRAKREGLGDDRGAVGKERFAGDRGINRALEQRSARVARPRSLGQAMSRSHDSIISSYPSSIRAVASRIASPADPGWAGSADCFSDPMYRCMS